MEKKIKDLTQNEAVHICSNHLSPLARMVGKKCEGCPLFKACERALNENELNTIVDTEEGYITVHL